MGPLQLKPNGGIPSEPSWSGAEKGDSALSTRAHKAMGPLCGRLVSTERGCRGPWPHGSVSFEASLVSSVSENPSEGPALRRSGRQRLQSKGLQGRWRLDTDAALGRQPLMLPGPPHQSATRATSSSSCTGSSVPPWPWPAPWSGRAAHTPGSAMPGCRWRERRLSQQGRRREMAKG